MGREITNCMAALIGALLAAALSPALAQQPTPAQSDAIRASCRSDFMADCSGVQPGGREALQCLQHNIGKLSPPCKSAVAATLPAPPPAAAAPATSPPPAAASKPSASQPKAAAVPPAAMPPPAPAPAVAPLKIRPFIMPQRRIVILGICGTDVTRLCQGVPPGGERLLECLAAHPAELTKDCYAALARVSER